MTVGIDVIVQFVCFVLISVNYGVGVITTVNVYIG